MRDGNGWSVHQRMGWALLILFGLLMLFAYGGSGGERRVGAETFAHQPSGAETGLRTAAVAATG